MKDSKTYNAFQSAKWLKKTKEWKKRVKKVENEQRYVFGEKLAATKELLKQIRRDKPEAPSLMPETPPCSDADVSVDGEQMESEAAATLLRLQKTGNSSVAVLKPPLEPVQPLRPTRSPLQESVADDLTLEPGVAASVTASPSSKKQHRTASLPPFPSKSSAESPRLKGSLTKPKTAVLPLPRAPRRRLFPAVTAPTPVSPTPPRSPTLPRPASHFSSAAKGHLHIGEQFPPPYAHHLQSFGSYLQDSPFATKREITTLTRMVKRARIFYVFHANHSPTEPSPEPSMEPLRNSVEFDRALTDLKPIEKHFLSLKSVSARIEFSKMMECLFDFTIHRTGGLMASKDEDTAYLRAWREQRNERFVLFMKLKTRFSAGSARTTTSSLKMQKGELKKKGLFPPHAVILKCARAYLASEMEHWTPILNRMRKWTHHGHLSPRDKQRVSAIGPAGCMLLGNPSRSINIRSLKVAQADAARAGWADLKRTSPSKRHYVLATLQNKRSVNDPVTSFIVGAEVDSLLHFHMNYARPVLVAGGGETPKLIAANDKQATLKPGATALLTSLRQGGDGAHVLAAVMNDERNKAKWQRWVGQLDSRGLGTSLGGSTLKERARSAQVLYNRSPANDFFFVSGQGDGGDWDIGPSFQSFLEAAFIAGGHPEYKGFRPTYYRKLMHVFLKDLGVSPAERAAFLEHTTTTAEAHYELKEVLDLDIDYETLYQERDTVEHLGVNDAAPDAAPDGDSDFAAEFGCGSDDDDDAVQEREKPGLFQFSPNTSPEKPPATQATPAAAANAKSSSTEGVAGVAEDEEVEDGERVDGGSGVGDVEATPAGVRTSLRLSSRPLDSPRKKPETGGAWMPYKTLSPHKGNTVAFKNFVDDWKAAEGITRTFQFWLLLCKHIARYGWDYSSQRDRDLAKDRYRRGKAMLLKLELAATPTEAESAEELEGSDGEDVLEESSTGSSGTEDSSDEGDDPASDVEDFEESPPVAGGTEKGTTAAPGQVGEQLACAHVSDGGDGGLSCPSERPDAAIAGGNSGNECNDDANDGGDAWAGIDLDLPGTEDINDSLDGDDDFGGGDGDGDGDGKDDFGGGDGDGDGDGDGEGDESANDGGDDNDDDNEAGGDDDDIIPGLFTKRGKQVESDLFEVLMMLSLRTSVQPLSAAPPRNGVVYLTDGALNEILHILPALPEEATEEDVEAAYGAPVVSERMDFGDGNASGVIRAMVDPATFMQIDAFFINLNETHPKLQHRGGRRLTGHYAFLVWVPSLELSFVVDSAAREEGKVSRYARLGYVVMFALRQMVLERRDLGHLKRTLDARADKGSGLRKIPSKTRVCKILHTEINNGSDCGFEAPRNAKVVADVVRGFVSGRRDAGVYTANKLVRRKLMETVKRELKCVGKNGPPHASWHPNACARMEADITNLVDSGDLGMTNTEIRTRRAGLMELNKRNVEGCDNNLEVLRDGGGTALHGPADPVGAGTSVHLHKLRDFSDYDSAERMSQVRASLANVGLVAGLELPQKTGEVYAGLLRGKARRLTSSWIVGSLFLGQCFMEGDAVGAQMEMRRFGYQTGFRQKMIVPLYLRAHLAYVLVCIDFAVRTVQLLDPSNTCSRRLYILEKVADLVSKCVVADTREEARALHRWNHSVRLGTKGILPPAVGGQEVSTVQSGLVIMFVMDLMTDGVVFGPDLGGLAACPQRSLEDTVQELRLRICAAIINDSASSAAEEADYVAFACEWARAFAGTTPTPDTPSRLAATPACVLLRQGRDALRDLVSPLQDAEEAIVRELQEDWSSMSTSRSWQEIVFYTSRQERLSCVSSSDLTRQEFECALPGGKNEYISDGIINAYICNVLCRQAVDGGYDQTHKYCDTFFWEHVTGTGEREPWPMAKLVELLLRGPDGKPLELSKLKKIYIPLHTKGSPGHWRHMIVNRVLKRLQFYDPLGEGQPHDRVHLDKLRAIIISASDAASIPRSEVGMARDQDAFFPGPSPEYAMTQQGDGKSCGVSLIATVCLDTHGLPPVLQPARGSAPPGAEVWNLLRRRFIAHLLLASRSVGPPTQCAPSSEPRSPDLLPEPPKPRHGHKRKETSKSKSNLTLQDQDEAEEEETEEEEATPAPAVSKRRKTKKVPATSPEVPPPPLHLAPFPPPCATEGDADAAELRRGQPSKEVVSKTEAVAAAEAECSSADAEFAAKTTFECERKEKLGKKLLTMTRSSVAVVEALELVRDRDMASEFVVVAERRALATKTYTAAKESLEQAESEVKRAREDAAKLAAEVARAQEAEAHELARVKAAAAAKKVAAAAAMAQEAEALEERSRVAAAQEVARVEAKEVAAREVAAVKAAALQAAAKKLIARERAKKERKDAASELETSLMAQAECVKIAAEFASLQGFEGLDIGDALAQAQDGVTASGSKVALCQARVDAGEETESDEETVELRTKPEPLQPMILNFSREGSGVTSNPDDDDDPGTSGGGGAVLGKGSSTIPSRTGSGAGSALGRSSEVVQAADPGWATESLTLVDVAENQNKSRAERTRAAFDKQRKDSEKEAHHHPAPSLKGKKRADHKKSLEGFYPLEFDNEGEAINVEGQAPEPEGGHLWLQHLEDMHEGGADQCRFNAEMILGIASDLFAQYPRSVLDWSQVLDPLVVPTILKLVVKLPNNGSTSSFPPISFHPREPAGGGGCSRTTGISPIPVGTLASPEAPSSRKRKAKTPASSVRQQKPTPTVDYPAMAGSEHVTSDEHDANKAKVVNLEPDHEHCDTLVHIVYLMRKLLVKQGLTNAMILSLYDISFQFASGPTPFHTDDSDGDGPGRYIMNVNVAGKGLFVWKGDPAGDSFFNPRGVLVGPGDITTMGGEYRHIRVHEVLRVEEEHSPMVVDAPATTKNVRCVMTCRFGKQGKTKTPAGLWNYLEAKVLPSPSPPPLPPSFPRSLLPNNYPQAQRHTHTHTHTHNFCSTPVRSTSGRWQSSPGRPSWSLLAWRRTGIR